MSFIRVPLGLFCKTQHPSTSFSFTCIIFCSELTYSVSVCLLCLSLLNSQNPERWLVQEKCSFVKQLMNGRMTMFQKTKQEKHTCRLGKAMTSVSPLEHFRQKRRSRARETCEALQATQSHCHTCFCLLACVVGWFLQFFKMMLYSVLTKGCSKTTNLAVG